MRFTLDGDPFELTPEIVRARLQGCTPESIRSYWVEIDGTRWPVKQVISVATGVHDRQRFQSQASRRWLTRLGFPVGSTEPDVSPSASVARPPSKFDAVVAAADLQARDVVLVGCVKSKRQSGALARDLYTSDYFLKMRAYAEATGAPWFILSAEHGLVDPEDWLEPYERYLPDTSREYRRAWSQKVAAQLEQAMGSLPGLVIDVHAGATYVESLAGALREHGAEIVDQLQGLSFGRRLSWYLQHEASGRPDGLDVLSGLRDVASAMTLAEVLATAGSGLRMPGMYSWWVDEAGAADLSTGLGHPVAPGLLYAGLAGATRSGGKSSSNTLWGRISTMHLGKNHNFSTLRLSLGSTLANAHGQTAIDEAQLTHWMHAHLRLITIPVGDADSLDALETDLLTALDPPLNLAKVAKNPLRQRLSALRKQYGGQNAAGR